MRRIILPLLLWLLFVVTIASFIVMPQIFTTLQGIPILREIVYGILIILALILFLSPWKGPGRRG